MFTDLKAWLPLVVSVYATFMACASDFIYHRWRLRSSIAFSLWLLLSALGWTLFYLIAVQIGH